MKKKYLILWTVMMVMLMVFTACTPGTTPEPAPTGSEGEPTVESSAPTNGEPTAKTGKIGYVTGIGGLGDNSFSDLGHRGIKMLEEEGFESNIIEPSAASEYEAIVRNLCEKADYDLIVVMGSETVDAVESTREDFPDQKFLIIEVMLEMPNVRTVQVDLNDMGFLMGAYAALMEQEGALDKGAGNGMFGIVGGMDFPLIRAITVAYECGARYINPDNQVLVAFAGSFADPGKGSELAMGMYDQGASVVAQAAGATGMGVFEAAKDRDLYALGSDTNQNFMAPDNIIASASRRVDLEIYKTAKAVMAGEFEEGAFLVALHNDPESIKLEYDGSNIIPPASVVSALEKLVAFREANEIELPQEEADIQAYLDAVGVFQP